MAVKVADGFVDIHGRVDRNNVRAAAREVANLTANEMESTNRRRSRRIWQEAFSQFQSVASAQFGGVSIWLIAAIAAAAPAIGAALTVALLGGAGLAFIALGAFVLKENKKIADNFKSFVKDLQKVVTDAAQPLVQPFIGSIGALKNSLKTVGPLLKGIFAGLAPMVKPLTIALTTFVENILAGIQKALPGINAVLKAITDHLPALGTAIGDFFATLGENAPLLERITGILMTWVSSAFKALGPILTGLTVIFGDLVNTWRALVLVWQDLGKKANPDGIDKVATAVRNVWTALKDVWGALTQLATANSDEEILAAFENLGIKGGQLWDSFKELIKVIWSKLWSDIKDYWNNTVEPWLKSVFNAALDYLITVVGQKLSALKDAAIAQLREWVAEAAVWFATLPIRAAAALAGLPGSVAAIFINMASRAVAAVVDLISRVVGQLATLPGRAASAIAGIVASIAGVLNNAVNVATSLGAAIIRGVVSGVTSSAGALTSAVRRAAENALDAAKHFLGIGSPSKVFAREVGRWIPRGIQVGIESQLPQLNYVIRNLAQPIAPFTNADNAYNASSVAVVPKVVYQTINVSTNEIDPRYTAARLGFELNQRM